MAENENKQNEGNGSFSMNMANDVPKFSGDDKTYSSTRWLQDIDDNAEIFGWTALQKLIIARRSLVGTAALWLRSEKAFKSYEDLKTALQKEFPDSVNSKEMHEIMSTRKKRKDETFYQYLLVMKDLGRRAKFPDYVSLQYLVDGINDHEMNKAILYGVVTFGAMKEKLALYEKMKEKTKRRYEVSDDHKKAEKPRMIMNERRCYKCGDSDHLAMSCTKGIKCFRCNGFGHKGADCRLKTGRKTDENHEKTTMMMHTKDGATIAQEKVCTYTEGERDDLNFERTSELLMERNATLTSVTKVNNIENVGSLNKSTKVLRVCDENVLCLLDTGSDLNLVTLSACVNLGLRYESGKKMILSGLADAKVCTLGNVLTSIEIDDCCYDVCFHVVPDCVIPYSFILGQPFIAKTLILFDKGSIKIFPQSGANDFYLSCLFTNYDEHFSEVPAVKQIIDDCQPLHNKEAPIKSKIILKDDVPVSQRPRRQAIKEEKIVKDEIQELLSKGVMRPSYSEYASPLVLAKKKDGSTRLCVDYRLINQKIIKDERPFETLHCDHLRPLDATKKLYNYILTVIDVDTKFVWIHLKILEWLDEENKREFMARRDDLRAQAKTQILKIQEENKRTFNRRRKKGQEYKVGDFVAIQRTQFGNHLKLKQKYFGPYRVVQKAGNDRYDVEKVDNSKEGPKKTTTGVDFMKRWA